jgi:hypothetical protein
MNHRCAFHHALKAISPYHQLHLTGNPDGLEMLQSALFRFFSLSSNRKTVSL